MDYVKFIYRPLTARAARQVLVGRNRLRQSPGRGRFTHADVDALLKSAWANYAERVSWGWTGCHRPKVKTTRLTHNGHAATRAVSIGC